MNSGLLNKISGDNYLKTSDITVTGVDELVVASPNYKTEMTKILQDELKDKIELAQFNNLTLNEKQEFIINLIYNLKPASYTNIEKLYFESRFCLWFLGNFFICSSKITILFQ